MKKQDDRVDVAPHASHLEITHFVCIPFHPAMLWRFALDRQVKLTDARTAYYAISDLFQPLALIYLALLPSLVRSAVSAGATTKRAEGSIVLGSDSLFPAQGLEIDHYVPISILHVHNIKNLRQNTSQFDPENPRDELFRF